MIVLRRHFLLGLFVAFLISGCSTLRFSDVIQAQDSVYLSNEHPIGQTLITHHAGLSGLELFLTPQDPGNTIPVLISIIFLALFLFVLPGLALVHWFLTGHSLHWSERLGVGAALSISLYPLLFLWGRMLGLPIGELLAWIPGSAGGLYLLWAERAKLAALPRRIWSSFGPAHVPDWALLALLLLLFVVRILPIRTLPAPMWGDSVHHTMIVQLLGDNGGLFDSWAPYAPLLTMTYHFGFHTAAAVWEWIDHLGAPRSVLVTGQVLNVLALLALVPLTFRLSGRRRWASVGAVLVAGFLSQMPGYYVNWGRYTQLASQVIFPVLMWTFAVWLTEHPKPKRRFLLLMTLLAVGLVLTHYRVATVAAAAGVAWILWAYWVLRNSPREWLPRVWGLMSVALFALLIIIPWILVVRSGQLSSTFAKVVTRDINTTAALWQELQVWSDVGNYYPSYLLAGLLAAWIVAFWKRREIAVPLAFFAAIVFLMTNPFLFGLPGTGWISNFLLVIGAYIPMSLLLGWFASLGIDRIAQRPRAAYAILILLLLVAIPGARTQLRLVDTTAHQMVTQSDVAAFRWISANTPDDAYFLVNGFLAYNNSIAVGSDAGWWLPLYTQRAANIPPMPYANERTTPQASKAVVRQLILDVQASAGERLQLHSVLCQAGLTHVYLGQRRGRIGYGSQPLVPSAWLQGDSALTLLHQEDQAQVWRFEREEACTDS